MTYCIQVVPDLAQVAIKMSSLVNESSFQILIRGGHKEMGSTACRQAVEQRIGDYFLLFVQCIAQA